MKIKGLKTFSKFLLFTCLFVILICFFLFMFALDSNDVKTDNNDPIINIFEEKESFDLGREVKEIEKTKKEEKDEEKIIRPILNGNIRFMSYNIKAGWGLKLNEVIEVVKMNNVDVLAVQEIDVNTDRSADINVDTGRVERTNQVEKIEDELGMYGYFFKAIEYDGGDYGIALFSVLPLVARSGSFYLNQPEDGENVYQTAEINLDGISLFLCNTHLSTDQSVCLKQMDELSEMLEKKQNDIIVFGDFNNSKNVLEVFDSFHSDGALGNTYPADFPKAKIDYILYSPSLEKLHSEIISNEEAKFASDHLPILVDLKIK